MKRRSFLKLAGGGTLTPLLLQNSSFVHAKASKIKTGIRDMQIDEQMLENRNQNRSTVVCQNGIVCTSQPLASMAGIDILKAGGNAIDAAIGANAVLGVVEPMSCGLGGDLFAIVWIAKEKKLFGLNASGRSPYEWSIAKAKSLGLKEIPVFGPLSWSVPGCVSGWDALSEKFGKVDFSKLMETAILYARNGFPVSPIIAENWQGGINNNSHPSLIRVFAPNGAPRFGDIFKNQEMASSFELLVRDGPQSFYHGEIADKIVRFSQENGGLFSKRDFEEHRVSWVDPVSSNYRGYDVWELPPNGQGIATLQILNILEYFDIASLKPNSAEHLHLFIEAKKLAFEDRAVYYADMDFADVPLDWLISKQYGRNRAKLINTKRAAQRVTAGKLERSSDTIYLTAADKHGNMVSLIQSTYYGFGSKMVPDGLGFTLQNRGSLFSLNENHRNKLEPHKRPFHTIIPGFVTKNQQPYFSFGVMGGDFQPQGHAQVLMNLIDFKMSPQQVGEQPRVAHSGSSTPTGSNMKDGGTVILEHHISQVTKENLMMLGHNIAPHVSAHGGYQGILRENAPLRYFGGSDPRKDGCAFGY